MHPPCACNSNSLSCSRRRLRRRLRLCHPGSLAHSRIPSLTTRQQCTNARFLSLPRLTPRDVVTRFFASTWSGERASPSLLFPLPPRCRVRDALRPSSLGRSSIARCTKGAMARRQHRIGVADRCHALPSPAAISTSLAAATVFATPPASPANTPPALLVLASLAVLNRQRRGGQLGLAKVAWVGLGIRVEARF